MKYEDLMNLPEPSENQGPMPQGDYDRLEMDRDRLARIVPDTKRQLDAATRTLARIAVACTGALDPELTREQVVGRVKFIYSLAADDDGAEADFEDAAGLAEGP